MAIWLFPPFNFQLTISTCPMKTGQLVENQPSYDEELKIINCMSFISMFIFTFYESTPWKEMVKSTNALEGMSQTNILVIKLTIIYINCYRQYFSDRLRMHCQPGIWALRSQHQTLLRGLSKSPYGKRKHTYFPISNFPTHWKTDGNNWSEKSHKRLTGRLNNYSVRTLVVEHGAEGITRG